MAIRKLINNQNGAGIAVLLIVIPFILTLILTMVFIPIDPQGISQDIVGMEIFLPANYANNTEEENRNYLAGLHDGYPTQETRWWEFGLTWHGLTIANHYMVFPDGYEMKLDEYNIFLKGGAGTPNYVGILGNMLTLDPPALRELETYGIIIRIIMIVCVAIGLTDLLWLG